MKTVKRMCASLSLVILLAGYAVAVDLPRTGQQACYDSTGKTIACANTGQDGDKQAGSPWPIPRYTDNNNGTVTDNLTGLVWLRNANCWGSKYLTRDVAIGASAALANGACGLSDGSVAGDWRLPNINELRSLIDYSRTGPAITAGHPFYNVNTSGVYQSSTNSFCTYMSTGVLYTGNDCEGGNAWLVWPVRNPK